MRYDRRKHHRRSIRLAGYDYTASGAYFVTICTRGREDLLGEIEQGRTRLNRFGEIVQRTWAWLGERSPHAQLDVWVVMPNHVHGIVLMGEEECRGGSRTAPTGLGRKPLGRLVGAFKTVSTKNINEERGTPGMRVWQRNYWERVVRDEEELNRVRQYIIQNPLKWAFDRENPKRAPDSTYERDWGWLEGNVGAGPRLR